MLDATAEQMWNSYLAAESRGMRAEKLVALNLFLDELTKSPLQGWSDWACGIAERVVDRGDGFVIRIPLFERAIFPALREGFEKSSPGHARWLAGLLDLVYRSRTCREQLPERGEFGLLRAALRHDPLDLRSQTRLVQAFADQLRYSLHALPSGVLYGTDGASIEDCKELEKELDEFCQLIEGQENHSDFDELVKVSRFHFRKYREYLETDGQCTSYAQFLELDRSRHAIGH